MKDIIKNMSVDRCPNCKKIISPQERVCANCGFKLDNKSINRINSIYRKSNIAVLIYFLIFFIGALIYAFVNWVLAIAVVVVLFSLSIYLIFRK